MDLIPVLLPDPVNLSPSPGICDLRQKSLILLDATHPHALLFSASRLQSAIHSHQHISLEIYAGKNKALDRVGITLRLESNLSIKSQGYRLKISPRGILIEAQDEAGIFYACCTLIQLIQFYTFLPDRTRQVPLGCLPCAEIYDQPDFLHRGVMLDVSRDKVPTMETIFDLVDLLASWKINQLQLYTEHTFAYQMHPEVWAEASPFTGEEILKLDVYCRERYIELVPNQNSFGHFERWLKLPRYKPLAEAPDGFDFPWGHNPGPFSLCPLDPGSLSLLQGLYDELLPHFSSRQFNVGCDETFDLGQGRSKSECERLGTGHVYLDFLLKIYHEVTSRGYQMQFWGDIIIAHPDLVDELPKDVIALEWGYEGEHPFDQHGERFAQAGIPFYLCPGTSAWNSLAGRTENCLMNLANAAISGTKHGADGYLIADWGDNGHWQALPVNYLGFAAGAAYAWSYQANQNLDIREALNLYAFRDTSRTMGPILYDLGNVYQQVEILPVNASALFHVLQKPISEWQEYWQPESALRLFHHTLDNLDQITPKIAQFSSKRSDEALLKREFILTVNLLHHACMRGLYAYGSSEYSPVPLSHNLEDIITEYRQVWLLRNRPGGLDDSLTHFNIAKKEYQEI